MQNEITKIQPLLNDEGEVINPGWARHPYWIYDRRKIAHHAARIKEWDYYLISNETCAVAFTISDLGYAGMASVSLIDLVSASEHTETVMTPLPLGRMGLRASSSSGSAEFRTKRLHLQYSVKPGIRKIRCIFHDFKDGSDLTAEFLIRQPEAESMSIATPWQEDPKAFYYNQKINCMPAKGKAVLDGREYVFDAKDSMAVLDWGRGVWTYDNTWYWGTCSCRVKGKAFGFNLGYGFSDRSSATENVIFHAGRAHKLNNVTFNIPENDQGEREYTKPWSITSDDGRFEAVFIPVLDRKADIDLKLFSSDQHQVFGHITGTAILDDGREVKMRDIPAALEVVHNRY